MIAQDLDAKAVHMAYVQFSLLHIPAIVVRGNTLELEELEHWYTPAHIMGGWGTRLRSANSAVADRVIECVAAPVAEAAPVFKPAAVGGQFSLFELEAA